MVLYLEILEKSGFKNLVAQQSADHLHEKTYALRALCGVTAVTP